MDLGNGLELNLGKLDYSFASDEELRAASEKIKAVGETRGLWVPEAAGQLVVAQTVDIEAERARLLGTVEEGASLFNGAVESINAGRRKKDHIPFTPTGEYRERAEDWLTEGRVKATAQLPTTKDRPLLVIPRLSRPITTEENVSSWKESTVNSLWGWDGRMKFLSNWTPDQLSGFDPELEDADRLEVIPTAYDEARQGTVTKQKTELERLQKTSPELDAATIFDGSVLARRYMNQSRDWKDSYVRGITLAPTKVGRFAYVPRANVHNDGDAGVRDSDVDDDRAARLRVR